MRHTTNWIPWSQNIIALAAIALLTILCCCLEGPFHEQYYSWALTGHVYDESDSATPIAGAIIWVDTMFDTTGADGSYALYGADPAGYKEYTLYKSGYETIRGFFYLGSEYQEIPGNLYMQRKRLPW